MKDLRTLLTGYTLRTVALGAFCALGAFAVGIETAGDVRPFVTSEAAIEQFSVETGPLLGDANGDGILDPSDAFVVLQASEGIIVPTQDEVLRGDMDGDGRLTRLDLSDILRILSSL